MTDKLNNQGIDPQQDDKPDTSNKPDAKISSEEKDKALASKNNHTFNWDNEDEDIPTPDDWNTVKEKDWSPEAAEEGQETNQKLKNYDQEKWTWHSLKARLKDALITDKQDKKSKKRRYFAYGLTVFLTILLAIILATMYFHGNNNAGQRAATAPTAQNSKIAANPKIKKPQTNTRNIKGTRKDLNYYNNYEIEKNNILIALRKDLQQYLHTSKSNADGAQFNSQMNILYRRLNSINPKSYIPQNVSQNETYSELQTLINNQQKDTQKLIQDLYNSQSADEMLKICNTATEKQNKSNNDFLDAMQDVLKNKNIKYQTNSDGNLSF